MLILSFAGDTMALVACDRDKCHTINDVFTPQRHAESDGERHPNAIALALCLDITRHVSELKGTLRANALDLVG